MSREQRRILKMLSEGKITLEESERLLAACWPAPKTGLAAPPKEGSAKAAPKYLRITVESNKDGDQPERVNVRIPLQLLRSGIKLGGILPDSAREKVSAALADKGISFDLGNVTKTGAIDELIEHLCELTVDVDSGTEKVRIYCE